MADLRSQLEMHREACELVRLGLRAGRCSASEAAEALDEADDRHGELSSGDALDGLRSDHETGDFETARESTRRLIVAIERIVLGRSTRELDTEILERQSAHRFRIGKLDLPRGQWLERLSESESADDRREIQEMLDRGQSELRLLREERFARRLEVLNAMHHGNHLEWAALRQPQVDSKAWSDSASLVLEASEPAYRDALAGGLSAIGSSRRASRADLIAIERRRAFDRFFPLANLANGIEFTTRGLGLALADLDSVTTAPALSRGAVCTAPHIPGRIQILHATRGGADTYESCLEASGRAFAFAFCSASLPIERRAPGDPALEHAWGRLFANRTQDRDWIERGPAAVRADVFAETGRFLRLLRLRRAAALARVEIELAALGEPGDPRPLGDFFADLLSDALGCSFAPEQMLGEANPELPALDQLRSACLVAQLEEYLRAEFGQSFWQVRGAGELLKELWNTGSTYSAEGIADQLGLGKLSVELAIESCLRESAR
ncbi:MAG: hypothetical protein GY725_21000 [bacterium]|nr:hypothetical protein [bacterium]